MVDPSFADLSLPAGVEDAGFAYGRACGHLLQRARVDAYLDALCAVNRTNRVHLAVCAERWAERLPERYQLQIEAMGSGAAVPGEVVRQWLYADIAAPAEASDPGAPPRGQRFEGALIGEQGPMCTGLVVWDDTRPWLGRNCDWYPQTLSRGTCAVRHRVPNRIPIMAVGLMGDVDADTGINAEGLWLHMHTLPARDESRAGVSCISWLFWMREALETCATISDVARFIAATDRDRGVLLLAVDGKNGEAALFECGRSTCTRVDPWASPTGRRLVVTNHPRAKHPPHDQPRASRPGGTVSRYRRVEEILDHAHPVMMPDDLAEVLSDPLVEMRHESASETFRTIYSAVCDAQRGDVWFASGGVPAASGGTWRRVRLDGR